ncbi:hypothetical protein D6D13_06156 [Aureobasidium pullulans]|uniref:Deoxyribonuclease NucA/NucB domain-containing protein n=1 Tax=Aureobasidium pullulans TaxID=5580 RepID=A0A4S9CS90_AURPU|nr:hypothetical protein D6D13_06156 [Aureobasidium pullulans]
MIFFSFSIICFITFTTITTATPLIPPLSPREATNGLRSPTIIWSYTNNRQPSLNIPSVCANMCYGAYCRGYSSTLTWDNFANKSYAERKYNAGCVGPIWDYTIQEGGVGGSWDRCKEVGRECSVYPFLSTREGDVDAPGWNWGPVSRCVDAGENARQGIILYSLYFSVFPFAQTQGLNSTPPSPFHQIFANAGEISYCSGCLPDHSLCAADGEEADRMGTILSYNPLPPDVRSKQRSKQRSSQQRILKLKNGGNVNITISGHHHHHHNRQQGEKDNGGFGVVVGTKVKIPRVRDEGMFVRQSESHIYNGKKGLEQYAYMASNLYFEDHEIEGVEEGLMESMVGC